MATSEINEYFHARLVQILKAPELISIWTILRDLGAVSRGSEKTAAKVFKNGRESPWDAILK